jgi:hypothetical protein
MCFRHLVKEMGEATRQSSFLLLGYNVNIIKTLDSVHNYFIIVFKVLYICRMF